ncbi:MAG TPA: ribosome silencing factor [Gemmatimonadota bacterium]|nr:ribosome silencing factor [Gemmatimonadota bacterium]
MSHPARRSRGRTDPRRIRMLVGTAAEEAIERKGRDVVLLDLRGVTSATDWFVLVSGESDIQVRSIAERIEERLARELDARPWHVEGLKQTRWILLDYVDFVVHVFHHEARAFYDLERLWADAPAQRLDPEDGPPEPD